MKFERFGTLIIGLVWIAFIWFLIVSFLDIPRECPQDIQMTHFLTNYGDQRIQTKESCYEGCNKFIDETGYQINCQSYCR